MDTQVLDGLDLEGKEVVMDQEASFESEDNDEEALSPEEYATLREEFKKRFNQEFLEEEPEEEQEEEAPKLLEESPKEQ